MKYFLLIFAISSILYCRAQDVDTPYSKEKPFSKEKNNIKNSPLVLSGPTIVIDKRDIELGVVPRYIPLHYNLLYTNKGNSPLLISNVRASCSCTVTSYSNLPLLPRETDTIKIEMNTDHIGKFRKLVAIYSNATNDYDSTIDNSRVLIHLNWEVKETKQENE